MILEDTETHIRLAVKVDCSFQMWLNGVFCEHVVNDSKGWQLNELVKLQLYFMFHGYIKCRVAWRVAAPQDNTINSPPTGSELTMPSALSVQPLFRKLQSLCIPGKLPSFSTSREADLPDTKAPNGWLHGYIKWV